MVDGMEALRRLAANKISNSVHKKSFLRDRNKETQP